MGGEKSRGTSSISEDDTPLNDPNSIELELLSNLVADYSEEHFALGEPTLVDVLKLRMYEWGLIKNHLQSWLVSAHHD